MGRRLPFPLSGASLPRAPHPCATQNRRPPGSRPAGFSARPGAGPPRKKIRFSPGRPSAETCSAKKSGFSGPAGGLDNPLDLAAVIY